MHSDRDLRSGRLTDAVELFKTEFRKRYPESEIAIDGEGYEDDDSAAESQSCPARPTASPGAFFPRREVGWGSG